MSDTFADIEEILEYLPHRYPFLLVDKIVEMVPYESVVAIKNVTMNEPFFAGHFPGQPVFPGVLMLEALAQASAFLAFKSTGKKAKDGGIIFFAGIDNARFKRVVRPGDQLRLEIKIIKIKKTVWKAHAEASVDGELACSADLMSAQKEDK
jgi:3-hydroxyacyl-[acyl-carrier-protein] dehydratase